MRQFSPGTAGTVWTKSYLAVTQPDPDAAPLPAAHDGPIAEWTEHPIRSRMRVHAEGKPARTLLRTLQTRDGKALVLARPVTGRKHQIRVHLADLGYPVVGDKVYSLGGRYYLERLTAELDEAAVSALQAPHQLLHAVSLEIRDAEGHGITGTDFDLPEGFRRFFPTLDPQMLQQAFVDTGFSE